MTIKKTKKYKIGGMLTSSTTNLLTQSTIIPAVVTSVAAASTIRTKPPINTNEIIKIICDNRKNYKLNPDLDPVDVEEKALYDPLGEEKKLNPFDFTKLLKNLSGYIPKVVLKLTLMQLHKSTTNVDLFRKKLYGPRFVVSKYDLFFKELLEKPDEVVQNFKDACKCIYLLYNYKFAVNYGFLIDRSLTPKLWCIHAHYIQKQYDLNKSMLNKKAGDFKTMFFYDESKKFTKLYNELNEEKNKVKPPSMFMAALKGASNLIKHPPTAEELKSKMLEKSKTAKKSAMATAKKSAMSLKSKIFGKLRPTSKSAPTPKKVHTGGGIHNKTKKLKGGSSIVSSVVKTTDQILIGKYRKKLEESFKVIDPYSQQTRDFGYIMLHLLYEMHHFRETDPDRMYYQIMVEIINELDIDSKQAVERIPYNKPSNEFITCASDTAVMTALNIVI